MNRVVDLARLALAIARGRTVSIEVRRAAVRRPGRVEVRRYAAILVDTRQEVHRG